MKCVLHLCSFAQEFDGKLTIVGAGIDVWRPGDPIYLAGFVYATGEQFCASDFVVEMHWSQNKQELLRVPPPPQAAFEGPDREGRLSLTLDLGGWLMVEDVPMEYQFRVRLGEEVETLKLHVLSPQTQETQSCP